MVDHADITTKIPLFTKKIKIYLVEIFHSNNFITHAIALLSMKGLSFALFVTAIDLRASDLLSSRQ